jgi:hypothetical protein
MVVSLVVVLSWLQLFETEREMELERVQTLCDLIWSEFFYIKTFLYFFFPDKSMLIEDLKGNFLKDWYAKYYVFINFVKW